MQFATSRAFADCVHCGLCLNACPTYLETGLEPDSPRGRIYLMKGLAEGRLDAGDDLVRHLDLCLGCRACETACPSGVGYGHLIEESRAWLDSNHSRGAKSSFLRHWIVGRIMADPALFRASIQAVRLASRLGFGGLAAAFMPPGFDAAGWANRLRPAAREVLPATTPATPPVHGRVAFLTGCVMDGLFADINAATVRLLAREGWEVRVPRGQVCCGALAAHNGLKGLADDMKAQNSRVFDREAVDYIVTNAAGCGATLRLYEEDLAGKVRDVTEILALHPLRSPPALKARVAYHDACHLAHGQGVTQPPRTLLAQLPDIEVVPLPESDVCCGSAGSYNITEADMAARLGARKAESILETGAEIVTAGNAGCLVQIGAALDAAASGRSVPRVRHIVDVLESGSSGAS